MHTRGNTPIKSEGRKLPLGLIHLGAGATTAAANLALAAAEAGRKVVLVDGNLREPAVSELL
ncbi:MAG: hypothetical protein LC700_00965, partial [Actinobacteria bacterium]|nr:hypothetical protein [Actinomycetota bacterium]